MSRRVLLRPDVPSDIEAIISYLEVRSPAAADRFVENVFAAFEDLAVMPGKGSPKQLRSTRLAGVRSWSVPGFRNHLILYRELSEAIEILAVTHGSRRLRSLLLQRLRNT